MTLEVDLVHLTHLDILHTELGVVEDARHHPLVEVLSHGLHESLSRTVYI